MTIFNKSKMEIGASVLIKPIKIQEQGIEGNFGIQDQWYVQIDGEDATTYTGYKDGQQDWHGDTLTAAMENDLELILHKTFNTKTQRAKYDYRPNKGQSATPPTKARQDAPTALKQAPVLRRDTKSITIGMYACVKAAGSLDHKNVDELISDATHIFKAVALFAETYRPDLDKIGQKMVEHEVPPDFWDWLINANKVSTKMDLSAVATQYTLDNWATVVARYINDAERAEQDEDVIREQELDEKLFSTKVEMPPDHFDGPDGTNYPKQHQERCPDPAQEDHGTFVLTTGEDEMPPF